MKELFVLEEIFVVKLVVFYKVWFDSSLYS